MKRKKLFAVLFASALVIAGCGKKEQDTPSIPQLGISPNELALEAVESSNTFTVTSNRDWKIESDVDWLSFEPKNGKASSDAVNVKVTALANAKRDRTAAVKVTNQFDFKTLTVKQKGAMGAIEPGDGTAESPYSVVKALEIVRALAASDNNTATYDDKNSVKFYVKGIIANDPDFGSDEDLRKYGNAKYQISDDGSGESTIQIFQSYYLGNVKFTSRDQIKKGDEVIIHGTFVNFKGNTPETMGKGASYIYSLNGTVVEKPDYNKAELKTVADFISAASTTTYYRLKGKVSSFKKEYCSFDLTDETGTIYVYSVANKDEWKDKIKDGGTVELAALYALYTGSDGNTKHEAVQAQILSFEEAVNQPMSVAEALGAEAGTAVVVQNAIVYGKYNQGLMLSDGTNFMLAYNKNGLDAKVGDKVNVPGAVATYNGFKQIGAKSVEVLSNGNEVSLPDPEDITGMFDSFKATTHKYITFKGTLAITKSGDGKVTYYNVEVKGASSMKGSIQYPLEGAVPEDLNHKLVRVTGFYCGVSGNQYQNVMMTSIEAVDAAQVNISPKDTTVSAVTTSVKLKVTSNTGWVLSSSNEGVSFDKTEGNGDATVTVSFPANASTTEAVTWNITATGAEDGPSTITIKQKPALAPLVHALTSNLQSAINAVSANKAYPGEVTVNGSTDKYYAVKFGTASAAGSATVTLPAGTKRVGFYATGWKGKDAELQIKVGDTVLRTLNAIQNDGATSSSPFALVEISENVHYFEVVLDAPLAAETVVTMASTASGYRAVVFGINAYTE